jgi:hypothetical protein
VLYRIEELHEPLKNKIRRIIKKRAILTKGKDYSKENN